MCFRSAGHHYLTWSDSISGDGGDSLTKAAAALESLISVFGDSLTSVQEDVCVIER